MKNFFNLKMASKIKNLNDIKKSIISYYLYFLSMIIFTSVGAIVLIKQFDHWDESIFCWYLIFILGLCLGGFWRWRNIKKQITLFLDFPLKKIAYALKNNKKIIIKYDDIEEIKCLSRQIENWRTNFKALQKEKNTVEMIAFAAQAAHDIRSPLAALDVFTKSIIKMPEDQRHNICNAINRINAIANHFLNKYKKIGIRHLPDNTLSSEPVFLTLDNIVSEKRAQYSDRKNITFELIRQENTVFDCANINADEFKRTLSNLINNAVEATNQYQVGKIQIQLEKDSHKNLIIIKIIDNGCGIPENLLPKIIEGGLSLNKKNGMGFGVSYAVKCIKNWGAEYQIYSPSTQSQEGQGVCFMITLAISRFPVWFLSRFVLKANTVIFILDADKLTHQQWQEKFRPVGLSIKSFYSTASFIAERINIKKTDIHSSVFLINDELPDSLLTGVEIIQQFDIVSDAVLMTSRYDNAAIRERCENIGLKILPKRLMMSVPVVIKDIGLKKIKNQTPDLILIDNDSLLTKAWQLMAALHQKKIIIFNTIHQANKMIKKFDPAIPIYIDSDLESHITGEEYAKTLYQQGFKNLYLTTGHDAASFESMYWIKAIVGKEPVFNI